MGKVVSRAKKMYDEHRFGKIKLRHCRGISDREDAHLPRFLAMVGDGSTMYDIGCGVGYWMQTYHKHGIDSNRIVALDLAPANVRDLNSKGYQAGCGDIQDLPFDDEVADFTVCQGVLHHCADTHKGFKELVRITKPGGSIYLSVYNKWHPYFYVVHKMTWPFRYVFWNWNETVPKGILYPFFSALIQPVTLLTKGAFMDRRSCMTLFMDQVMTPRAHLFTKRKVRAYAQRNGCRVLEFAYNRWYDMLVAIIEVKAQDAGKNSVVEGLAS